MFKKNHHTVGLLYYKTTEVSNTLSIHSKALLRSQNVLFNQTFSQIFVLNTISFNADVPDQIPTICQRRLVSMTEDCSTASALDGSPAESLEWDSCDNIHTALDTDTEQLLCEIERLTARALKETGGDWTYR